MSSAPQYDVVVVGGGLAGLVASIVLAKAGKAVLLIEKKKYPYHKVCGEYVSNEVLGYLKSIGFDPYDHGASSITKLRVSSPSGRNIHAPLDLGAFGLSRYTMDEQLAQLAVKNGAEVMTGMRVTDIQFQDNQFKVTTVGQATFTAHFVIGSWGKRELLDKKLQRSFIEERTSYMAVKYHARLQYPADEIGLDNFKDGYCGISKIEGDRYNICSFYKRPKDKQQHTSIEAFRTEQMFQNPVIRAIFKDAEMLLEEPIVINEISFAQKPAVEHHVLMCGDSAGLITPLCGNGMSMAIGGAKLVTDLLLSSGLLGKQPVPNAARALLEEQYKKAWSRQFSQRLFWGRTLQHFFGHPTVTELALKVLHTFPPIERNIIRATHGKPIA